MFCIGLHDWLSDSSITNRKTRCNVEVETVCVVTTKTFTCFGAGRHINCQNIISAITTLVFKLLTETLGQWLVQLPVPPAWGLEARGPAEGPQ